MKSRSDNTKFSSFFSASFFKKNQPPRCLLVQTKKPNSDFSSVYLHLYFNLREEQCTLGNNCRRIESPSRSRDCHNTSERCGINGCNKRKPQRKAAMRICKLSPSTPPISKKWRKKNIFRLKKSHWISADLKSICSRTLINPRFLIYFRKRAEKLKNAHFIALKQIVLMTWR